MQVPSIQQRTQSTSFQMLRISKGSMPDSVYSAIKASKAFEKFGSLYDAEVSYCHVGSRKYQNVAHPALIIENIQPISISKIFFHLFKPLRKDDFIYFMTHGTRNEDLVYKINNVDENKLIKDIKSILLK